jgi:hypothetical protein
MSDWSSGSVNAIAVEDTSRSSPGSGTDLAGPTCTGPSSPARPSAKTSHQALIPTRVSQKSMNTNTASALTATWDPPTSGSSSVRSSSAMLACTIAWSTTSTSSGLGRPGAPARTRSQP